MAARQAPPNPEGIMKSLFMATCVLAALGSTCAFAQNSGSSNQGSQDTSTSVQPGSAGKNMDRAANAGVNGSSGQGPLMQQRSQAMSPQGASDSASTGKMKQQ
jgi:hypothetical protein